jgi:hypothetical protein
MPGEQSEITRAGLAAIKVCSIADALSAAVDEMVIAAKAVPPGQLKEHPELMRITAASSITFVKKLIA